MIIKQNKQTIGRPVRIALRCSQFECLRWSSINNYQVMCKTRPNTGEPPPIATLP